MRPRTRLLAWGLMLLGIFTFGATFVFTVLAGNVGIAAEVEWGSAGLTGLFFSSLPIVTFLAVGSLLALRRPANAVGWLCLVISLFWIIDGAISTFSTWAIHQGNLGFPLWAKALNAFWVPALGLTGTHLPLRLPNGVLLSPRWRWYAWFCTVVILLIYMLEVTQPGLLVADLPGTDNPLGSAFIQNFSPLFVLFPLSFIGAITSLVLRYRRAGGVERLQLRWLAFGGVVFLAVFIAALLLIFFYIPDGSPLFQTMGDLTFVAYTAIPICIGMAVLRYRLYEIDTLINRTLVYVPLTVILAMLFSIAQEILGQLLRVLWGDNSTATTVFTTLFLVAVFEPVKKRIESLVDKFSKQIPDPARTVKKFREKVNARELRVDSDTITQQLLQEVIHGFGATSGAIYVGDEESLHLKYATRNWNGLAKLTIPLTGIDETRLGVMALGPQRIGGEYSSHQCALLHEMASIATTAIVQDRQAIPLQASPAGLLQGSFDKALENPVAASN